MERTQTIHYTIMKFDLGWLLVASTEHGVCNIALGDNRKILLETLKKRFPTARISQDDESLRDWASEIIAFVRNPKGGFNLPLDVQGTPFQQRVWKALREIPPGKKTTYQKIAQVIGKPLAHRAVANACGANPLALLIPCHRVLRKDGQLGGYRWGTDRKRQLLRWEEPDR